MKEQNWRDFLRMKSFLRPYAWQLGFMILIGLTGSALGLAQPYLSKYLVDNALMRRDSRALVISAVLMFAATIAGFIWAKSMMETRGIAWAFGIHFVQDLVIFYFLAMSMKG